MLLLIIIIRYIIFTIIIIIDNKHILDSEIVICNCNPPVSHQPQEINHAPQFDWQLICHRKRTHDQLFLFVGSLFPCFLPFSSFFLSFLNLKKKKIFNFCLCGTFVTSLGCFFNHLRWSDIPAVCQSVCCRCCCC